MTWWTDLAPTGGPVPNTGGPAIECRGISLHIAEGSYAGTVAWCRNASSEISAQWVCAKDGTAVELVEVDRTAWTQAAGNGHWLSIEFEGRAGDSLTPQQIGFAARVLAKAHQVYGVPLQLADSPSGRGLGWHGMGGAAWGGHTGCPGAPIVAQRPAILARAVQIINGGDDAVKPVVEQGLEGMLVDRKVGGVQPEGWLAYELEQVIGADLRFLRQIVDAWRTGAPKTKAGDPVAPVAWELAAEADRAAVRAQLSAITAQLAVLSAAVAALTGGRPAPKNVAGPTAPAATG